MKIGFVTCQDSILSRHFPTLAEPELMSPEPLFTPDDYIAVTDLRTHGHEILPVIWGTPPDQLPPLELLIVRSPWDYSDNAENKHGFFNWLHAIEDGSLPIANPVRLMQWLLDKEYLKYFPEFGIQTIPADYLRAGAALNLSVTFKSKGSFVLKQCIAAGGKGLFFIDSENAARQSQFEFDQLLQATPYMLQPYIPEIKTRGEWSLIFFGDCYSHSILKKPAEHSILVHGEHGGSLHFPVTPPAAVRDFAEQTYAKLPQAFQFATGESCSRDSILYMRIDVIESEQGPVLVECEGVEPELFFRAKPGSAADFRHAIMKFSHR